MFRVMSDQIGRLNAALEGRYTIERELGEGGMAKVYLAVDQRHDRNVAIKVLKPELAAIIGAERFLAEIQTTANLQHPHILPLHDSGEVDGTVFYVMPFVEGESLRELLDRERQLRVAEAVRVASEVADALDYAHRQGVVHRDIKPENVLLHDGRALVADFGIALAASRTEGSERLTETGMSLGTPHYMSPEQAMGEPDIDGRADIYAVGCVLYEMLTGEPPFTAPSAQAIVAKLLSSEPEPVTNLRKTVPPHVAGATHVALEKLPADRFATAAELRAALADETRVSRAAPPSMPGGRVRGLVPWAVAAAAVAVAAFGLFSRSNEPETASGPLRVSLVRAGMAGDATPSVSARGGGGRLTISRDGRIVVFVGLDNGVQRLYRRSLDDPEIVALAGTEGAAFPALSPDGRSVAFGNAGGGVSRMSLDGGAPTEIAKLVAPPIGISWSETHGLVFGMLGFVEDSPGITTMAVSGDTTLRFVTRPELPESEDVPWEMHHNPIVFPDDETIGYLDIRGSGRVLSTLRLSDAEPRRTELPARQVLGWSDGVLVYMDFGGVFMAAGFDLERGTVTSGPVAIPGVPPGAADGVLATNGNLVFQRRPTHFEVALVDQRGNATTLVAGDSTTRFRGRYSPDGSRIAMTGDFGGTRGTWLYDLTTRTLSPLPVGYAPQSISWTPDGRRIVTVDDGDDPRVPVHATPADASDTPSSFAHFGGRQAAGIELSPDGRTLAITEDVGTNPMLRELDIVLLDLADGTITDFAVSPSNETAPRFSASGRWLAYASNESGRYEVYARPFPGPGGRVQISAGGGSEPVWSPDGRRIYYRLGRAFMAADLSGTDTNTLTVTGRTRLFEGAFRSARLEDAIEASYDVAPDGSRLLLARAIGSTGPEIMLWTRSCCGPAGSMR
jgi:serine/threonine-protein kinase